VPGTAGVLPFRHYRRPPPSSVHPVLAKMKLSTLRRPNEGHTVAG
jgi:hypothetical protein